MRPILCLGTLVFAAAIAWSAPMMYRPSQEYRTINAALYEVSVQKDGRVDIVLRSGQVPFENAFPMVWFEGEEEPEELPLDGRFTSRKQVNDRLGQGQGMVFKRKSCEWAIRVYPDKPFLTCQVAYVNRSKKPVRVKALLPWCADGGRKGGLSLGSNTHEAVVLSNPADFPGRPSIPALGIGEGESLWNIAAYNPVNQRSFIGGFLTTDSAYSYFKLWQNPKEKKRDEKISFFQSVCVYDPPVTVPPGGTLQSEVLYLSVADLSPHEGLERYGHAVAAVNEVPRNKPLIPHGWDSSASKYGKDISAKALLGELEVMDAQLGRYGWTHFSVGAGWERLKGDWRPDPERFPEGLKPITDAAHARNMTASLWIDAFAVSMDAPIAKEHPDWLVAPSEAGRALLGPNERILDVTIPEAYEHVRALFAVIGNEWGFDAVEESDAVFSLLLAEHYADESLTRADVLRTGIRAICEGLGNGKSLSCAAPFLATGVFAQTVRLGRPTTPAWSTNPENAAWGCQETLTNAARRYYLGHYLWTPDPGCAYFAHPATLKQWQVKAEQAPSLNQSIAWLTAAAFTGGAVRIGDAFTDLTPDEFGVLRKLLPSQQWPARPVDIFEDHTPRIWSLTLRTRVSDWHTVGLFNWDADKTDVLPFHLTQAGLSGEGTFTVFDFWHNKFLGLAQGLINVEIPPGSVRVLGFRPYRERPTFLALDSHFTQGATQMTALEWDRAKRKLQGTFEGIKDTDYCLSVLVPSAYTVGSETVSTGKAVTKMEDKVLRLRFRAGETGPITWAVSF